MFIIKKTGLVPVKDVKTGDVFGVSPDVARTNVLAGNFALVMDIPEDYETEEVDGPVVNKEGFYVKPEASDKRGSADAGNDENTVVEIPEDWRSKQHLVRIKLAKDLFPDYTPTTENGKWTADLADQKIQEAVDARLNAPLV